MIGKPWLSASPNRVLYWNHSLFTVGELVWNTSVNGFILLKILHLFFYHFLHLYTSFVLFCQEAMQAHLEIQVGYNQESALK